MPRTRDGFVPLGDVSQAVALPGDSRFMATLRPYVPTGA